MAEDKKVITPHELAAQGDPDAQEYLRWVKLKRRKEELLNKLSTTAGVAQKFRDPEFNKAQEEYSGSTGDLARRALEATAMPGNVLKAAIKTPEGASESRMGQVVRAIKATTGLPEDAFKENRIEGSDFTDNETLASAIDIGADLAGGAAAAAGTKALVGKMAKGAIKAQNVGKAVSNKVLPGVSQAEKQLGSLDLPSAKVLEPENKVLFQQLEDQQLLKKLKENQAIVDSEDAAEAFRKRPEFSAVDPEPKSMLNKADVNKLEQEIADSDYVKSQDLMERLSGASDSLPTVEERATEILNERLMKSSDPIPVEIFPNRGAKFFGPEAQVKSNYGTKILAPNEPVTAAKMLKGLETYGSSGSSKLSAEQAVKLQQVLKASKKGKK